MLIPPLAMLALGLWGLTRAGAYGNDEAATHWAATLGMRQLFHLLSNVDAVHGLYYFGMHVWMAVVGVGPIAMRMPSVLAATAAVAVVTVLGRRLSGSLATGVIGGLVVAVNPSVTFYAQTARSYAIVLLLVAVATLLLLRALDAEVDQLGWVVIARRWVGYALLMALAGYMNEMALLVLGAHGVSMLLARCSWPARLRWLGAAVGGMALVTPLLVISGREDAAVSWIVRPGIHEIAGLVRIYFGHRTVVMIILIGCTLVALLPVGTRTAAPADEQTPRRPAVGLVAVAAPLLVVPPTVLVVESILGRPLFAQRYVVYSALGAGLLAAAGARRIGLAVSGSRPRLGLWAPGLAVVLCTFLIQLPVQVHVRQPDSRLRNFAEPAAFVANDAHRGDGVLFLGSFFRMIRLGYPHDFVKLHDFALAETPMESGTFRGIELPYSQVVPRMLAHRRIWAIGRNPYGEQVAQLYAQECNLLISRYRQVFTRRFTGENVSLWVRRPVDVHRRGPYLPR